MSYNTLLYVINVHRWCIDCVPSYLGNESALLVWPLSKREPRTLSKSSLATFFNQSQKYRKRFFFLSLFPTTFIWDWNIASETFFSLAWKTFFFLFRRKPQFCLRNYLEILHEMMIARVQVGYCLWPRRSSTALRYCVSWVHIL